MVEIWKNIESYPGYQVSNLGRIKSFKQSKEGRILNLKGSKGYLKVDFCINGKIYQRMVHRIVLSTFAPIQGWEELTVNHIDGNTFNNKLENLEWMTSSENTSYSRRVLRTGNATKRVHVVKLNGDENFYESTTEAAREMGVSKGTISRWANKQRSYEGKYRLVEYI